MTAPSASTTISSRRVKPPSVRDVAILTFAAVLAVRPERDEIERLALPRDVVAIVVAPRVLEVGVLRIRAVPAVGAGGLLHQRLQAVGILAHLELVHLDLAGEVLDANLGFAGLGPSHLVEDRGAHERHDAGEQDEHDHDLQDREAALAARIEAVSHRKTSIARWVCRRWTASPRGWR